MKLNLLDKLIIWTPLIGLIYPIFGVPNEKLRDYLDGNPFLNNCNLIYHLIWIGIITYITNKT